MTGSYISATVGELRGIPAAEPILRLTVDIEAGGLADGTPDMGGPDKER
jgi:hypothetical protein